MTHPMKISPPMRSFGARSLSQSEQSHRTGADRRIHDRIPANFRASIFCHNRFQTVTIHNISCGGVMMADAFGLAVGDEAVLSTLTSHPYVGRVAWSVAPYTGLAFQTPIDLDDPLFQYRQKHGSFTES